MPANQSPRWLFFSETESIILKEIESSPGSAADIAKRAGLSNSGNFRTLLSNMVARKVLVIGSEGYQLNA